MQATPIIVKHVTNVKWFIFIKPDICKGNKCINFTRGLATLHMYIAFTYL
jgi:hypothetical protein